MRAGRCAILQKPGVLRLPQIACIDADKDVRLGLIAFDAQALKQLLGAIEKRADFDAGCFLERSIERTVGLVVARGVDVDKFAAAARAGGQCCGRDAKNDAAPVQTR